MKKILTLALCMAAVGSMSAQKEAVKTAQKLSGKLDKIAEARAAIKGALENPETSGEANTWFVAAEIENKGYDAMKKQLGIQPSAEDVLKMDQMLINGYPYLQAAGMKDQKGDVKGKVVKSVLANMNNYYSAGADFFNNNRYPEAYEAFMIFGNLPDEPFLQGKVVIPDTVRAASYYNAGMAAYFNPQPELRKSAGAFKAARMNNYNDPKAYIYELSCWQNLMEKDSTVEEEARKAILDVSRAGWDKYGMSQPIFLNNLVNVYVGAHQEAQAIEMVNELLANNDLAALYGLRGFVYDRMGKDAESVADYLKAASYSDVDYETLKNAAMKLYRTVADERNNLDIRDAQYAEKKAKIKADLEKTLQIAQRAKSNTPEGASTSQIDYVIENAQYALEGMN